MNQVKKKLTLTGNYPNTASAGKGKSFLKSALTITSF